MLENPHTFLMKTGSNNAFGTFTHICRPTPEFFCIVPQIFTMVFGHMIGIDNRLNTVFFKPVM